MRAIPVEVLGHSQSQAAAAESERAHLRQSRVSQLRALFQQDIAADYAEVADAVGDQAGNVIVAYEQQIYGQCFAKTKQAIARFAPAQSRRTQQLARRVTEAAGFLDRDAQTVAHRRGGGRAHRRAASMRCEVAAAMAQGGSVAALAALERARDATDR